MLLAPMSNARAPPPTVLSIRGKLQCLVDTLRWQGAMNSTYGPVLDVASQVYRALSAVHQDSKLSDRAQVIREALDRLMVESKFFVDESSDPAYIPDPLETPEYLTASIDEWRHAIAVHSANLESPVCDLNKNKPLVRTYNVSSTDTPGTIFRDNALAPLMVIIPTGTFTAGSDEQEQTRWNVEPEKRHFELPKRQVTISRPLAFSKTEVSFAEFDTFIQLTCYKPRGGARWWDINNVTNFVFNPALTYENPGFPQTPQQPVVAITRYDAEAYASWLSGHTGATYRLPTEDEWEWAARGGATTTFFWGNDMTIANQYANTYDNTAAAVNRFSWPSNHLTDGFPHTAPVGSFKPNAFGLHDMTGNVREFMADNWLEDLSNAPRDGSPHIGPAPFPTVRGGAWNYNPKNLRLNYRSGYLSSEVATNMFGIRLVREL